jgi:hypothetical protein
MLKSVMTAGKLTLNSENYGVRNKRIWQQGQVVQQDLGNIRFAVFRSVKIVFLSIVEG